MVSSGNYMTAVISCPCVNTSWDKCVWCLIYRLSAKLPKEKEYCRCLLLSIYVPPSVCLYMYLSVGQLLQWFLYQISSFSA